ncbi:MAG: hypothetical protein D6748_06395 [Calditrichaeota bacterium]|nr:MAG: hypothetical protein D6748_06395 [Calditrichota bacterium]
MSTVSRIVVLLSMVLLVLSCGGVKTLTQQEYENLSTQERIQYLNKQVEKHPEDLTWRRMLYQEYLNADMVPQALSVMEDILARDPYQSDVQFKYGELQYRSGNYKEAYHAFLSLMQSAAGEAYREPVAHYVSGNYVIEQVTSNPADEGFPSFTSDGKKLVFQRKQNDNWDIVEYDFETQSEKVLVSTPADEELPVLSPDEKFLVYTTTSEDHRPIDTKFKTREIVSMDLKDQYVFNLTQSIADDWNPHFDRTGKYIAFVSDRADLRNVNYTERQSDIYIMESDGDFQHQLTTDPSNEGGVCFSADNKHLYFHSDRNGTYDIFTMKTDGSQVMTVIDNPQGDDVNPSASPDSAFIAFVSNRDGNYEIYRSRVDGSGQERLTFHPAIDGSPVWSPDGKFIAFHSKRNGNFDIFLINLQASTSQLTTNDLIQRLQQLVNN